MKRFACALTVCFLLGSGSTAVLAEKQQESFIRFTTMVGVDGVFVGAANPQRGFAGDDLPWEIESAKGSIAPDGHLRLKVRGVVFKDDPSVPEDLRGINDEPTFRAALSCITSDETGMVTTLNLISDPVSATTSGNADFDFILKVPQPCAAPVVFVLSGGEDDWFAVTGLEGAD